MIKQLKAFQNPVFFTDEKIAQVLRFVWCSGDDIVNPLYNGI